MKNLVIRISFVMLIFALPLLLLGQEVITVNGKVTTNSKFPLVKASVMVKSSGQEFFTDSLGRFILTCNPNDRLVVTANGFVKKRIKKLGDGGEIAIDMKLKPEEGAIDIAIGHDGHIREVDKMEMSKVNNTDVDFSIYHSVYDAIRGRVSGVHMIGEDIYLRGNTSISSNNAALLVVDGVIVSTLVFSSTPTSDIKSIKVLKGSAASIYGSRGGNGVIEVYTKRGLHK